MYYAHLFGTGLNAHITLGSTFIKKVFIQFLPSHLT